MNYTLEILAAAESDFRDAIGWYEAIYPQLAAEFKSEVTQTIQRLLINPPVYAEVQNQVHRAPVQHFPYAVFFTVIDETIVVIAVFHTSRSPSVWQSRI